MEINKVSQEINEWSKKKGWDSNVEANPGKFSEKLLLMISEIVEAMEEFRNGHRVNEIYYHYPAGTEIGGDGKAVPKPEGVPIELADTVIRIFHFCAANNIDLEYAIQIKMDYNKTRPFRHGNKVM